MTTPDLFSPSAKQRHGNFLLETSGILVHGCNATGGFDSGIAGQVLKRWPGVKGEYVRWFAEHPGQDRELGAIQVLVGSRVLSKLRGDELRKVNSFEITVLPELPENLVVVNAITQFFYGKDKSIRYVDYDAISSAFHKVAMLARLLQMPVNYPAIGAGLANGDWSEISMRIEFALRDLQRTHWSYP